MAQSGAGLAKFFVSQGQVVMSVGVSRGQRDSLAISIYGIGQASGFIKHVAQIEIGQGVARVGLDGGAVMLFCRSIIAAVVIKRAQVDVRGGVRGLQLQCLLVAGDGFQLGARIFFEGNSLSEQLDRSFGGADSAQLGRRLRRHNSARQEVHDELAAHGLHGAALMAEGYPGAEPKSSGFEQRILHARHLLQHGLQRLADDGGTHPLGAQVAHFFELQEIKERIRGRLGYQPSLLPARQLPP